MSLLKTIETYLETVPDEDIFELMYHLGHFNDIVDDWFDDKNIDLEEELKIVDDVINETLDKRWFTLKPGRYEAFMKYIHENMIKYYKEHKNE